MDHRYKRSKCLSSNVNLHVMFFEIYICTVNMKFVLCVLTIKVKASGSFIKIATIIDNILDIHRDI